MIGRDAAIAGTILASLIAVGLVGDSSARDFVIRVCIFGMFALSLNILIGYAGLVSFGHALFFAGGAYAFVFLMQSGSFSIPAALSLTILINAVGGLVIGAICVRSSEIYFTFLTLAFQMMFYSALYAAKSITGGDQGLIGGVPRPAFIGIDLTKPQHFYAFVCGVTVVTALTLRAIVNSPYGYALRMVRDNPLRAGFLGLNVRFMRLSAFVIASAAASVSGALMSLFVSGAYPNFAYWTQSGNAIFMVVLGGVGWFLGPFAGALFLLSMNDLITTYSEHYGLFLGAVILLVTLGLKKGLLDVLGHDPIARIRKRLFAWRSERHA